MLNERKNFKFNFNYLEDDIHQYNSFSKYNEIKKKIIEETGKEFINNIHNKFSDACEDGDLNTITTLYNTHKIDVNYQKQKSKTPLIYASKGGNFEIIKFLVENGADLNAQDVNKNTALMYATLYNYNEIAEYLITQGSNLNLKNNQQCNPLHVAASVGNIYIIKMLYERGMDLNTVDHNGNSPIFISTINNYPEAVKYFLNKHATIHMHNNSNEIYNNYEYYTQSTLLHICIKYDRPELLLLFIKHKININANNDTYETPLMYACKLNKLVFVKLLLSNGANPNIYSQHNYSCLHSAIANNNSEMVKTLIDYKSDYNLLTISHSLMSIHSNEISYDESILAYAKRYYNNTIIQHLESKNAIYYKCY
jgi:ankyrin repeat protein